MSTPKTQRQPLSDNNKKLIIIIAIVLAAVIAVSVTLGVLLKPQDKTIDPETPGTNPSSSLPIKNSNFALVESDDTAYPRSALNWNKYAYKAPNGTSHDFDSIDNSKIVMGIVDTDAEKWQTVVNDLKEQGVTLNADKNPKQHDLATNEKHDNSNVYMIATKNDAANALVMSDSVSVSATTSVKITVWINTSQLEGNATIMIQQSSSTPNAKEDYRYAYNYEVKTDGWEKFEFHVFNRKTSTQYIRVAVGLGNSYDNVDAKGVLYVDDISYETVTANDYRLKSDKAEEGDTSYKIIEKEEDATVAKVSGYRTLAGLNGEETAITYIKSDDYVADAKVDDEGYSPFTDKDDFFKKDGDELVPTGFGIYKLTNDGSVKTPLALQLSAPIKLVLAETDDAEQDYAHVSFWVRTVTRNELAFANVIVERRDSGATTWESMSNGDFTVKTEQNIATDTNNGWTKYDIYLKPAQTETEVRIVFALGSIKGYDEPDFGGLAPKGDLFVTTPYYETISSSAYTNASSSTAVKKYDLSGSTAETTVSNGSFSGVAASDNTQPTNWTPAFAGQNVIYKDGKGNKTPGGLTTEISAVAGSGVVTYTENGYVDDAAHKVLKLVSHEVDGKKSSYGMLSNDISLTAHTVYVFSVLARCENSALPYFYVIKNDILKNGISREDAIAAGVTSTYVKSVDGKAFCQDDTTYEGTNWTRYYIVLVTGDKDQSVKLGLFNGSIDGAKPAADGATVYYDKVTMQTVGTYSMVEDEDNKDATEYKVSFSINEGFTAFEDCEDIDALIKTIKDDVSAEIEIQQPASEEWKEMKTIPEDNDDGDDDDNNTDDNKQPADINYGLLFSILSSVLLVAALAIVWVIKAFKNRKNK